MKTKKTQEDKVDKVIVADGWGYSVPTVLVYDKEVIQERGCPEFCNPGNFHFAQCQKNINEGSMKCDALLRVLVRKGFFPEIMSKEKFDALNKTTKRRRKDATRTPKR